MALSLLLTLRIISTIIGIISIIYGIIVAMRFTGKLRRAVIFLMSLITITLILNFLNIFEFSLINLNILRSIGNLLVTILSLLAMLSLKQMINGIDGHYKKER